MSTLQAEHLAKSYKGREVVIDASLSVAAGEIVGLLGPNGAGKTTCFYMIVGMFANDEGGIFIDGEPVTHLAMHARAQKGIGYLPQEASIFRKMSVEIKNDDLSEFSIVEDESLNLSFSLHYLHCICMYQKISKEISIHLCDNFPLKIAYDLGEQAYIHFYLAPKMNDD